MGFRSVHDPTERLFYRRKDPAEFQEVLELLERAGCLSRSRKTPTSCYPLRGVSSIAFGWDYSGGEHMGVLSGGGYHDGCKVVTFQALQDALEYNDN